MHTQRGQTIPFWVIAVMFVLGVTFFVTSYGMNVGWQIRAQNAADSAASSGLSVHANVLNQESTLLYTAAVDEYRIRAINQAILNTMNGYGCKQTQTCLQDYNILVAEYNNLVGQSGAFASDIQLLRQANNFTQGGQQSDERKAISQFGQNCGSTDGGFDCAFTYNIIGDVQSVGNGKKKQVLQEVDVVACRSVAYLPMFVGPVSNFLALGRAGGGVVESVSPPAPFTPTAADQPTEPGTSGWNGTTEPDYGSPWLQVNFGGLVANLSWYVAAPVPAFSGAVTHDPTLDNKGNGGNGKTTYGCTTP